MNNRVLNRDIIEIILSFIQSFIFLSCSAPLIFYVPGNCRGNTVEYMNAHVTAQRVKTRIQLYSFLNPRAKLALVRIENFLRTIVIVPYANRIHPGSFLQTVQFPKSSLLLSYRFLPLINLSNQLPTHECVPNPRRKQR